MKEPNYKEKELEDLMRKDPYVFRLADEHLKVYRLISVNNHLLDGEIETFSKIYPHPPVAYRIKYKVNSITHLNDNGKPVFGKDHHLLVKLPINFPQQPAECKMLTDIWHPNIRSEGNFKGSICTNHEGFGSLFFVDELIIRIGEFLQYKRYLAENRPPWPEDGKVARWVKEVAEPEGIVDKQKEIFTDEQDWNRWTEEFLEDFGGIVIEEKPADTDNSLTIELEDKE